MACGCLHSPVRLLSGESGFAGAFSGGGTAYCIRMGQIVPHPPPRNPANRPGAQGHVLLTPPCPHPRLIWLRVHDPSCHAFVANILNFLVTLTVSLPPTPCYRVCHASGLCCLFRSPNLRCALSTFRESLYPFLSQGIPFLPIFAVLGLLPSPHSYIPPPPLLRPQALRRTHPIRGNASLTHPPATSAHPLLTPVTTEEPSLFLFKAKPSSWSLNPVPKLWCSHLQPCLLSEPETQSQALLLSPQGPRTETQS